MRRLLRALGAAAIFLGAFVAAPPNANATPSALEVEEVADTGSMPKGALLSRDGTKLYVTNFGQIDKKNVSVYDARTLRLLDTIDVPGIVVESLLSRDEKTLYLSNFRRSTVMFLDLGSKKVTREVKTGTHPKIMVLSRDGSLLFAANWASRSVTEIDTRTGDVVRTLAVGPQPRGMAMTKSGKLYVANFFGDSIDVFEGEDLSSHHRLKACTCPRHLALSPDDATLYVSCLHASQLQAIDVATEKVAHAVAIGKAPKSVSVSRDGRYVYSADYGASRSVSVVDTRDWTSRVFPVPGMDRGSGVVVAPDGEHAFVTGWYDDHVYRVGFVGTGGHPVEARAKIRRWEHRPYQADPGDTSHGPLRIAKSNVKSR